MLLSILASVFLLIWLLSIPTVSTRQGIKLTAIKIRVHEFSGLNPEAYGRFISSVEMFERSSETSPLIAASHLYDATAHASDIVYMCTDGGAHEKMAEIIQELAVQGEQILIQKSSELGVPFKSLYLKDSLNI
jgi:hypothetical protein